MTISYHSGGRLQGTSTDYNSGDGITGVTGGWKEIGRTTLGSAGDTISVTSLADKRYLMLLTDCQASGSARPQIRFNSDSGNNYVFRLSSNGASDYTNTSQSSLANGSSETTPQFSVNYVANLSTKEKLMTGNFIAQSTAGAGTAPNRQEHVGKWANTSNTISSVQAINDLSGDLASGSEVVVLGWDEDDTHTDNFWEELASTELTTTADTLGTGTFTAKKYLWVQLYVKKTGSTRQNVTFNNDTNSNYARRNGNNGTDYTGTNESSFAVWESRTSNAYFHNWFIINNSANEKLITGQLTELNGTGAGNAPDIVEIACKWTNTSSQITEIDVDNNDTGDYSSGSIIKVWGHD